MIRRAHAADVPAIGKIINDYAEHGLMLHRSLSELYESLRDYKIAPHPEFPNDPKKIVGVCGLKIVWANLAEVYALAVTPDARGQGIGGQLVNACIDDARDLGIQELMSLTYEKRFFEKLGFYVIDREQLPLKVWSECLRCPKNQACDEIAMRLTLDDVPTITAPTPVITHDATHTNSDTDHHYDVAVPLLLSAKNRDPS